jgi:hypothetical protein
MKKLLFLIVSLILLSALASCNTNKNSSSGEPKMLDVNLSVKPDTGKVGEPITFEAKVTQGNENVNDADDVVFEIWRSKDPNHEKTTIRHPKKGIYQLQKSFQQEGTYYIISHVTARGMHNMPKKEFVVGTPSEQEDANSSNSSMEGMK